MLLTLLDNIIKNVLVVCVGCFVMFDTNNGMVYNDGVHQCTPIHNTWWPMGATSNKHQQTTNQHKHMGKKMKHNKWTPINNGPTNDDDENHDIMFKNNMIAHMVDMACDNNIQMDANTIVYVFDAMEYGTMTLVVKCHNVNNTIMVEYKWKHYNSIAWYNGTMECTINDTMGIMLSKMMNIVYDDVQW